MNKNNIVIGSILAVAGLLMVIIPEQCVKAVVIMLGLGAVANGIHSLLHTRKLVPDIRGTFGVFAAADCC